MKFKNRLNPASEEAILGVAPAKSTGAFFNEFRKAPSKQNCFTFRETSGWVVETSGQVEKTQLLGAVENEVHLMSSNLRNSSYILSKSGMGEKMFK